MKRFFSVKDYLQTPKTNTHLFTANTDWRVIELNSGKLGDARSRLAGWLYRRQSLQVNTRLNSYLVRKED